MPNMHFQSEMNVFPTTCEIFYLLFLGYMPRGGLIFLIYRQDVTTWGKNTESYKHTNGQNNRTPKCLQLRTEGMWMMESETQNLSFGLTFR